MDDPDGHGRRHNTVDDGEVSALSSLSSSASDRMLLAAGVSAGAGDLSSGLDPRQRQQPPTRHNRNCRGRAPPSTMTLLPPTAAATARAHDPPYRGPGRRGRDGRRSSAAAHYQYPPPAGTAAAAPLFGRHRRRNPPSLSASNLALHDAATPGYSFRNHPGAAMGGVAHDHPMMQSAAAAGRFSHEQHQGKPPRARGEGGGRDRRLSAQHAGGRTSPRSPRPPKNTSTSPQHQYLNGGGHPLPPQPHLQAPPPRLSPPQPSSNLIVDPDLLVLDMRAYRKLEDAIVQVKLFLENVRHLAMERGLYNVDDGHEPSLFVSIITGECGDGTSGTILQSVLQKIFGNQEIQFFVSADGQSLQVDALSGFPEEEVGSVDNDDLPPIATATVPVPAPQAAVDSGKPGADRCGINPRDCDDDVPHNDDRLPAPIDEHRHQQLALLKHARAAEEEPAAMDDEAAARTGNALSLARSREEEAGSVDHLDNTPSNLAGDQSHTRTPPMLGENEEERHRVMLLMQAEFLQRRRLENLANADASTNTAAGSVPSQPVTREPPSLHPQQLIQVELLQRRRLDDLANADSSSNIASGSALSSGAMPSQSLTTREPLTGPSPHPQQLMQAELLQRRRCQNLANANPNSTNASGPALFSGAMPSQPGTTTQHLQHPYPRDHGAGMLYNPFDSIAHSLLRREAGGNGSNGSESPESDPYYNALSDVPTALGKATGLGGGGHGTDGCRGGGSTDGRDIEDSLGGGRGRPRRDYSPCRIPRDSSPGILGDCNERRGAADADVMAAAGVPCDPTIPGAPIGAGSSLLPAPSAGNVGSTLTSYPEDRPRPRYPQRLPLPMSLPEEQAQSSRQAGGGGDDGVPPYANPPAAVTPPLPEQGCPRPGRMGRHASGGGGGGGAGDQDVRQAIAESQALHIAETRQQVMHDIQLRRALERVSDESARDASRNPRGVSDDGVAGDDAPGVGPRRQPSLPVGEEEVIRRASRITFLDEQRRKREVEEKYASELEQALKDSERLKEEEELILRSEEELVRNVIAKTRAAEEEARRNDEELLRTALVKSLADDGDVDEDDLISEVIRTSLTENTTRRISGDGDSGSDSGVREEELEKVLKLSLEEKEHVPQLEEVLKLSLEEKEHVPQLEEVLKLSLEEKEHVPLEELENLKMAMEWSAMEECASMEGCGTFRGEFGNSSANKPSEWEVEEYEEEKCDRTRSGQDAAGQKRPSQRGMEEYEETFCDSICNVQNTAGPKKSSERREEYEEMKYDESDDGQDPPSVSQDTEHIGVGASSIGDH